jgi:hypothetical protein
MHTHHSRHAASTKPGPTTPTTAEPAVAVGEKGREARSVCSDDIRLRAYRKWEDAGKPTGDGVQFWLESEQELTRGK